MTKCKLRWAIMFWIWWRCLDLRGIQILAPVMRANIEIRPCVLSRFRRLPGQKVNGASPMIGLARSKANGAPMCLGIRTGQHTILTARCSLKNRALPIRPAIAAKRTISTTYHTQNMRRYKNDTDPHRPPQSRYEQQTPDI